MNSLERQMLEILCDLKENHHILGVKAEFESEGTQLEDLYRMKEMASESGLDLTIKIGGSEAIRDLYDCKEIDANNIIAPMIESPYAVQKFIKAVKNIFSEDELKAKNFFINIETKNGFNYLDEIFDISEFSYISGVVMGRTDLTASLNLSREAVNDDLILRYAKMLGQKALKYNKELIVGGSVSSRSVQFFSKLGNFLSKFETKKVIFDAEKALEVNTELGIKKAINFELLWIENKKNYYKDLNKYDLDRISMLNKIIKV